MPFYLLTIYIFSISLLWANTSTLILFPYYILVLKRVLRVFEWNKPQLLESYHLIREGFPIFLNLENVQLQILVDLRISSVFGFVASKN